MDADDIMSKNKIEILGSLLDEKNTKHIAVEMLNILLVINQWEMAI